MWRMASACRIEPGEDRNLNDVSGGGLVSVTPGVERAWCWLRREDLLGTDSAPVVLCPLLTPCFDGALSLVSRRSLFDCRMRGGLPSVRALAYDLQLAVGVGWEQDEVAAAALWCMSATKG